MIPSRVHWRAMNRCQTNRHAKPINPLFGRKQDLHPKPHRKVQHHPHHGGGYAGKSCRKLDVLLNFSMYGAPRKINRKQGRKVK